ncbi:MAG: hypothetical protein ACRC38_06110, partial [Plesiomonas sp.]
VSKELASHHEKVPPFLVSVSKLSGAGHVFLSLLFMTFILQCTWKIIFWRMERLRFAGKRLSQRKGRTELMGLDISVRRTSDF